MRPTARPARTSRSSREWSRPCTGPAWRSSSTWSTTTPPRATTWDPCCRSRASTTQATTGCRPRSPTATLTSRARATRSTPCSPPSCGSSWTRCATSSWSATSTAFASTWPARWRGSSTTSTASRRSSTPSTRTRCSRRSSSSPSPGTSGRAATRSATSRSCGASGTGCTATRCATSGAAGRRSPSSPRASPGPATCTATTAGSPSPSPGAGALYGAAAQKPFASVNFITAHDGFTLHDLVAFNDKHNEANQEGNRDGTDDNRSWNCGVEGPTDDPQVNALRAKQRRNFLTTLILSQGVPMLLGGDEICRTQYGNNNAWCQDNEISWVEWRLGDEGRALKEFSKRLIRLRREEPVFRRERFLAGEQSSPGLPDVWWFRLDGRRMTRRDWENPDHKWLGVFLNGQDTGTRDGHGRPVNGDSFLVMFNAHHEDMLFRLPAQRFGSRWELELTTAAPELERGTHRYRPRDEVRVTSRSITVLRRTR